MPSRAEMIAYIQSQAANQQQGDQSQSVQSADSTQSQPAQSRSDKVAFIQSKLAQQNGVQTQHGQAAPDQSQQAPGVAQTALEHFGNGAALGYLPQLQAGAEKV